MEYLAEYVSYLGRIDAVLFEAPEGDTHAIWSIAQREMEYRHGHRKVTTWQPSHLANAWFVALVRINKQKATNLEKLNEHTK